MGYLLYVAGAGGFEPPNAGIKSRCLRPLGYAPKYSSNGYKAASLTNGAQSTKLRLKTQEQRRL